MNFFDEDISLNFFGHSKLGDEHILLTLKINQISSYIHKH